MCRGEHTNTQHTAHKLSYADAFESVLCFTWMCVECVLGKRCEFSRHNFSNFLWMLLLSYSLGRTVYIMNMTKMSSCYLQIVPGLTQMLVVNELPRIDAVHNARFQSFLWSLDQNYSCEFGECLWVWDEVGIGCPWNSKMSSNIHKMEISILEIRMIEKLHAFHVCCELFCVSTINRNLTMKHLGNVKIDTHIRVTIHSIRIKTWLNYTVAIFGWKWFILHRRCTRMRLWSSCLANVTKMAFSWNSDIAQNQIETDTIAASRRIKTESYSQCTRFVSDCFLGVKQIAWHCYKFMNNIFISLANVFLRSIYS